MRLIQFNTFKVLKEFNTFPTMAKHIVKAMLPE
jgi:hypothetical protein